MQTHFPTTKMRRALRAFININKMRDGMMASPMIQANNSNDDLIGALLGSVAVLLGDTSNILVDTLAENVNHIANQRSDTEAVSLRSLRSTSAIKTRAPSSTLIGG